jgi:hypothetical protein
MNAEQVKTSVRVKDRNDFSDIEVYDIVECCSTDNEPSLVKTETKRCQSPQARKPNQANACVSPDEPL